MVSTKRNAGQAPHNPVGKVRPAGQSGPARKGAAARPSVKAPPVSPRPGDPSFLSFYEDGFLSPERVADAFHLSKTQLAETIGLRREALYKRERIRAGKTQGRVREVVELVDRIKEWAGGREQALAWYRSQPIPAFGGRTAEALVKDGKAGHLRDYFDHLAMGGFA